MSDEIVEKVALAIKGVVGDADDGGIFWPGIFREAARAAIAAMLEPLEAEAAALEGKGYRKSAKALRRITTPAT
jgi:hypothetical protein